MVPNVNRVSNFVPSGADELKPRRCPPLTCVSEQASPLDLADPELDRIGSDIEDGGLDLSLSFRPIGAYVEDKREMLDQCFHVLGEKKLRKMLPDELKVTRLLLSPCR